MTACSASRRTSSTARFARESINDRAFGINRALVENVAEIYKLTIGITLVAVFAFTVILLLASLAGWVKFRSAWQQRVLFGLQVFELCAGGVAISKNMTSLSPKAVQKNIERPLRDQNGRLSRTLEEMASEATAVKEEKKQLRQALDEKEKEFAKLKAEVDKFFDDFRKMNELAWEEMDAMKKEIIAASKEDRPRLFEKHQATGRRMENERNELVGNFAKKLEDLKMPINRK